VVQPEQGLLEAVSEGASGLHGDKSHGSEGA
jgi:hypothetical protein